MKKILITGLVWFLMTGLVSAQEDLADLLEMVEEIEITVASNVVTEKERQPVSITTISRQQLELSGARTLSEAVMMYVPGFFLVEDQDDIIAGFRGLAPDNNSKVMMLVDGQYMNTEWFWGPPDALLNTINYEWVDHIQVIRGPGSVTLGQGALLGVINIVTRQGGELKEDDIRTTFYSSAGADRYFLGALDTQIKQDEVQSYFYVSASNYDGQELRREGWAANQGHQGYAGGVVADVGLRLKRTENMTALANVKYKNLKLMFIHADQQKDLYNFYRDRNVTQEKLTFMGLEYNRPLHEQVQLKIRSSFAQDDFVLSSVDGLTTGGTREYRYGATAILNIRDLVPGNQLAVGVEARRFMFGRENFNSDNFIVNNLNESTLLVLPEANEERTWGFKDDISVYSLVLETIHSFTPQIDVFGALRYDNHPFWGDNISPRLGTLYSLREGMNVRVSWQTGFRGAPGVHYGGGYKNDGLLRSDSFSAIEDAEIPVFDSDGDVVGFESNISETDPETMSSYEVAFNGKLNEKFSVELVGFYNIIQDVIDVGVIWRDASRYEMTTVGNDVPGDWNGYWFFKNNEGDLKEYGFEPSFHYNTDKFRATLSHAMVSVSDAPEQQRSSMYLTEDLNFKAFPENVTRLHALIFPVPKLTLSMTGLYYYQWYSPLDQEVDGNFILNLGASYQLLPGLTVQGVVKNVLNADELYPMNSNAGGEDLSQGAPALEETTAWFKLKYSF